MAGGYSGACSPPDSGGVWSASGVLVAESVPPAEGLPRGDRGAGRVLALSPLQFNCIFVFVGYYGSPGHACTGRDILAQRAQHKALPVAQVVRMATLGTRAVCDAGAAQEQVALRNEG